MKYLILLLLAAPAFAQSRVTPCDPATPTNAVCITWAAVTTRVDGLPTNFPVTYRVEQQLGTGPFAVVSTGPALQAYVKNLAPGEYTFRVFAIESGKTSAPSNSAPRAIEQAAPNAPVIIIAVLIRPNGVPVYRRVAQVSPRPGEFIIVAPLAAAVLYR